MCMSISIRVSVSHMCNVFFYIHVRSIADAKPRLRDLQKMTYTDEDGTRVPFRLMGRMRPHIRQVAIALEFPQHNISIMTRKSDPVYYLLSKWLQGANPEDQRPVTWKTLITALQDAGVYEEARILKKYLVEPEPEVHDDETLPEGNINQLYHTSHAMFLTNQIA